MKCRHCGASLTQTFLDLGHAPPSNAYMSEKDLSCTETYYPLKVKVCDKCWLVQTEDYADARTLFTPDYAYFSSTSASWMDHAAKYAKKMIRDLALTDDSFVIEVASNDGYLLRNFIEASIPCLGFEPTASTASVAEKLGIPVLREFFGAVTGQRLAAEGRQADLIVGNNVYAHVQDINDFTQGLKYALKPQGTITLEFPHLMRLIENAQFDTVYHEHFSYLSLHTVRRVFASIGLRLWRVEELATHGGSLRVYGCHNDDPRKTEYSVDNIIDKESSRGLRRVGTYLNFQARANKIKDDLLSFLLEQKRSNKKVIGYGAAAKGNTLLNYAGIKRDLLPFICDVAQAKQGKFMPGSHIPIIHPCELAKLEPDYILVLPWNILAEVRQQNELMKDKGTRFVIAVPELMIL